MFRVAEPEAYSYRHARRTVIMLLGILTVVVMAFAGVLTAPSARADTAPPPDEVQQETLSSDILPVVQVDGVVWSQAAVGTTVYAGGSFATARPFGAAPGTQTTPRANLLAYDVNSGALITTFSPNVNGQVRGIAVSPDQSRVYIVGDFTQVNGQARSRIAAFNASTGSLLSDFSPVLNTSGFDVAVTNDTVYAVGWLTSAGKTATTLQPRSRIAAFDLQGNLKPFAPNVQGGTVRSIVASPDGASVVIAGYFTTVNGSGSRGTAKVDAVTGASMPWNLTSVIWNAGEDNAVYNLATDGDAVYGTGMDWVDDPPTPDNYGNFEGAFRADWNGDVEWIEDCHGDAYGVAPFKGVAYVGTHAHYCGSVGGFPQFEPWTVNRALAFTNYPTHTLTGETLGYPSFEGRPAPTLLHWYPDINAGTYTGLGQGIWTVDVAGDYVVFGGEFTRANGISQQGILRFTTKDKAPNTAGPVAQGTTINPSVVSFKPGEVRLSWQANYDRDNTLLRYQVIREDKGDTPVYESTLKSNWWIRPVMKFTDTSVIPGTTYRYRIRVFDPYNNMKQSDRITITATTADQSTPYSDSVIDDSPKHFWPLGESSGAVGYDWSGSDDLVLGAGVTRAANGSDATKTISTARFSGDDTGSGSSQASVAGPQTFSVESWFKSTSTRGGKIIGFGNSTAGNSSSYDRQIYLDNSGRVVFGVYPNEVRTVASAAGFNDGAWHHVVGTLGANGMMLYVDGRRVDSRADTTSAQGYTGYWRVGGDNIGGWPGVGGFYLDGDIDRAAVYTSVLTKAQVMEHYTASGRTIAGQPPRPADVYGQAVYDLAPESFWRLGETSGTVARDSGPYSQNGDYNGRFTLNQSGALSGVSNSAVQFDPRQILGMWQGAGVASQTPVSNPTSYSLESWFRTNTTSGGKIIGFGSSKTGLSSNYDRHLYMENDGRLTFGVWTGQANTITTPGAYNDNQWHHAVAQQGANGLELYIDGALVGTNPTTSAQNYSGYWRVGGDNTWGDTAPYFSGRLDEVAIYSAPLTAAQVAQHWALGRNLNAQPLPSFTATPAGLVGNFDASASSDPDGSLVSYSWQFGDGGTGSGATPTHEYAVGGTYTVTLEVTDNKGATASTTRDITVAPIPNAAPVAKFAVQQTDLTVALDGAESVDSDGSVDAYDWDFGDGTTDSGETTSHTYTEPGSYVITLTVTDDVGATATESHEVTVTAPPVVTTLAKDTFTRTTVNGWGAAETGGDWTVTGGTASAVSVASGTGRFSLAAGSTRIALLGGVSSTDTTTTATFTADKVATGGGAYLYVTGRAVASSAYMARVQLVAGGAIRLQMARDTVGLGAAYTLPGSFAAGDSLTVRTKVTGTSPTVLSAKVWRTGTAEPTDWQVAVNDSAAGLQAAGTVGIRANVPSGATDVPVLVSVDDFASTTPPVEPVPNAAPTASFTSITSGLTATFDGAGSSDSDGTVVGWAWDFGDGSTGSGSGASHPYAAGGTYTVGLTVTDDGGATHSTTGTVTVTAPPATPDLAADGFGRTVSGGWGNADTGGAWTITGGTLSIVSVGDGVGKVAAAAGTTRVGTLPSVSSSTSTVTVGFAIGSAPTGGGTYVGAIPRHLGAAGSYTVNAWLRADGSVWLVAQRGSTVLASQVLSGFTYAPGQRLNLKAEAVGTGTTQLRGKLWPAGQTEPTSWQVSTTDSTAALQAAGAVGVSLNMSGTSTAGSLITFDDFVARPAS